MIRAAAGWYSRLRWTADLDIMISDTARHDFTGDLTHEVIGAFYEVYNALPRGLLESAYTGALFAELRRLGIPVAREVPLEVHYRGEPVGWYRVDRIVDGRLLLELKTVPRLTDRETHQLYHYLRVTRTPLGLLLNFGPSAQVARVVNSEAKRRQPGEAK
jgi:GxxExxY protein